MNKRLLAAAALAALGLSACSSGEDDQKFCDAAVQWQLDLNAIGSNISGLARLLDVVEDPADPAAVQALRDAADEIEGLIANGEEQLAIAIANTTDTEVQDAFQGANDIVFDMARGYVDSARESNSLDAFVAGTLDDLEEFDNRSEEYQSLLRTVGAYGVEHCEAPPA